MAQVFYFSTPTPSIWGVIDVLAAPRFSLLWEQEFGSEDEQPQHSTLILQAVEGVRQAYRPFHRLGEPSDTLVTKVMLGTVGCLPACDRYFIEGFKSEGFKYSWPNARFVDRVFSFSRAHWSALQQEQARIRVRRGMHYPLMKLVDMYFNQIGHELESGVAVG